MGRWVGFVVLIAATVGGLSSVLRVDASSRARLIAEPAEGHAGDGIFLSGSGFRPNSLLQLAMACPTMASPSAGEAAFGTVRTDAAGHFVRARIIAIYARGNLRSTCAVYAGPASDPSAGVVPAHYVVLPRSSRPSWCAVHMCLHVKASLARGKSGSRGSIVLTGWPGALARVTVVSAGGARQRRVVRLDWRGTAKVVIPIATAGKAGVVSRVNVRAQLGRYSGSSSTRFTAAGR